MRTVDPVKHAEKKRHITDTAAGLFAQKGFERTTVADICRAADISTGSLFHYFPTKRAIFREIFVQDAEDNAQMFAKARELSPWDGVLLMVDHLCVPALDRSVAGLVLEVVAQASRDPELWELVGRNEQVMRDELAVLLQQAHDSRPDHAPRERADGRDLGAGTGRRPVRQADRPGLRRHRTGEHPPVDPFPIRGC